jgi:acyl-CoA synthetase (AMP-forming)/AMP-acid ligase II
MVLATPFLDHAARQPERMALSIGARRVDYATLVAAAGRVARAVAALPRRADGQAPRVALRMTNRVAFLETVLGTVMAGATVALFDPKWSAPQLAAATAVVDPALVVDEDFVWPQADGADVTRPVAAATPFLIGFTSGTSGRPKAFIRNQGSWVASLEASLAEFGTSADDHVLVPGPLVHGLSLYAAVEGLSAGAAVSVLERFDAGEAVRLLSGPAPPTAVVAVPTILMALLDEAGRRHGVWPGVRRIVSSGAKLPPALHERLAVAFPNAGVFEYYGASELSFVSVLSGRQGGPRESVGRPFRGVSVRIADRDGQPVAPGAVGSVFVRSAMVSDGYLTTGPDPVDGAGFRTVDGWATVGDQGWLDDGGFLHLAGREGDMLISGGFNVYPAEVEGVLRQAPGVAEAVVFGASDPYWGQRVTAVIWPGPDASANPDAGAGPTAAGLRDWCRGHLEACKCPQVFLLAADMPLTGSGKIARRAVCERALGLSVLA